MTSHPHEGLSARIARLPRRALVVGGAVGVLALLVASGVLSASSAVYFGAMGAMVLMHLGGHGGHGGHRTTTEADGDSPEASSDQATPQASSDQATPQASDDRRRGCH